MTYGKAEKLKQFTKLKMSAANEVFEVNTLHGTYRSTLTAACTLIIINSSEIILYLDCAVRTGLLTLHTADTAVGAVFSYRRALIVVRAFNHNALGVVDKVDDTVGALSYADTAADTLSRVNVSYAVLDRDGVLRTNRRAVAVAETGEGTELVATVRHIGGAAGFLTAVVVLALYRVTRAVAGNVRNLLDNVSRLNAEDGCDLFSGAVTAGNAEVGLIGSLIRKSLGIAVTA